MSHHEASCLSNERHCHLAVPDIEVHRAGALPPKGLIAFEKLFNVPSLRIILREVCRFISVTRAEECFEVVLFRVFPFALNELIIGIFMTASE